MHNYYRFLKIVFDWMGWKWELTSRDLPKKSTLYQPFFSAEEAVSLYEVADRAVVVGGRYGRMLRLRNRAIVRLSAITMLRWGEII